MKISGKAIGIGVVATIAALVVAKKVGDRDRVGGSVAATAASPSVDAMRAAARRRV